MEKSLVTSQPVQIAAFYLFGRVPQETIESLRLQLENLGRDLGLRGLVIFATEGLNGTICGEAQSRVSEWLTGASEILGFPEIPRKWSTAPLAPFRRFGVRIREEIVTLGKPEVQPLPPGSKTHLSPDEWDQMIESGEAVLVDTRNWYETRIGTFKGAIDPNIEEFSDFSQVVNKKADAGELSRDQKLMIFCTGGIRCEKAVVEMNNSGFKNVYQLDGGILNYLEQKPEKNFEGECFVFDHRVAVDQKLQPTVNYSLCPHCGQPADQIIDCVRCDTSAQICLRCLAKDEAYKTCSKNCANHFRAAPGRKGKSQGLSRFKGAAR
jgi:UPF0176 protein